MKTLPPLSPLAMLLIGTIACAPAMIPHTKILDTPDHRAVYDIFMRYVNGVQHRDFQALLAIASPGYVERKGNPRTVDPYGYEQLKTVLTGPDFKAVKRVELEVAVRELAVEGPRARVDYHYRGTFFYAAGGADRIGSVDDDNRITMEKIDGAWKIASGM